MTFQQPISGAEDSHARTSALQEKEKDLMEKGQDYSLNLLGLSEKAPRKVDPITYSLKTLETFYQSVKDLTSLPFSLNWTKSGMMQNGTLSTVPMWSPKIDKEFSLLDIIEPQVHQKYFLSSEQTNRLIDEWVAQYEKPLTKITALQQIMGGSQGQRVYAVSGKSPALASNGLAIKR